MKRHGVTLKASITIRLTPQLERALRDLCIQRKVTRAFLVRSLIAEWASRNISRVPGTSLVIDDSEQYLAEGHWLREVQL